MIIVWLFISFIIILTLGLFLNLKPGKPSHTRFSFVIACKNEADNLPGLFSSLEKISYPEKDFEIILVDDNSTDNTFIMMQEFALKKASYHALRLDHPNKGKKMAIKKGIEFAMFPYIILTDADCLPPVTILETISKYIDPNKQIDLLIGYSPEINNSLFRKFVYLITASFYASTTGLRMPFSCTGRLLVVNKASFIAVEGYKGFEDRVSGDDKLLLNKFIKHNMKIRYMYQPAMETLPVAKEILKQQDLRRFGKFTMNSLFWQTISVLLGLALLLMPYFVYKYSLWRDILILYIVSCLYLFVSARKHHAAFHPINLLIIVIYPYYLIIKSIHGIFKRWTWK
ncbi:MAG TPA: glycosyltransferase [Candidatus Cloacimonadota bacterium]|nr:glycosyltransferase [Candidatus Cloacimonadota bacterium]HQB41316.1 glycosyltransferase [Candidatus Cloacimonadota bacterium]